MWLGLVLGTPPPEKGTPQELEIIELRLGPKQFVQFQECLRLARRGERGLARKWVKASLRSEGLSTRCRLRLRGDSPNHWSGVKVSLRVKLPRKQVYARCREFNLIVPHDRGYFQEHCASWWSKRHGLIPASTRFVWVRLNGEDLGSYILLEELGEQLLERENRPFSQVYKADVAHNVPAGTYPRDPRLIYSLPFFGQKCSGAPNEQAVNHLFQEVLRVFRERGVLHAQDLERLSYLLDLDRWARFAAVCRVLGSHPESPHNVIVYFNSSTGLFEPVLQDPFIHERQLADFEAPVDTFNAFTGKLLQIDAFRARRDAHLEQVVAAGGEFLTYFASLGRWVPALARDENLLINDIGRGVLRRPSEDEVMAYGGTGIVKYQQLIEVCQAYLRARPRPLPASPPIFKNEAPSSQVAHCILTRRGGGRATLTLRHSANSTLGLRGLHLRGPGARAVEIKSTLPGVQTTDTGPGQVDFGWDPPQALPSGTDLVIALSGVPALLDVEPTFDRRKGERLVRSVFASSDAQAVSLTFLDESAQELFQAVSDIPLQRSGDKLLVPKGEYTISGPLIVPRGVELFIEAGTVIRLAPQASLVSYAPLIAAGKAEAPVVFDELEPGRGWGVLAVMGAAPNDQGASELNHVVVRGPRGTTLNGITYTGGVSFFASDVTMRRCVFDAAKAEDALNVKRARVLIEECVFLDSASDALDLDWCDGKVARSLFLRTQGDAIDLSGARALEVEENVILLAADKGVSVGEESRAAVSKNIIGLCEMGIASKDLSLARCEANVFLEAGAALAAYQKKPIFGGGEIISKGDRFLGGALQQVEDGSRIDLERGSRVEEAPASLQGSYASLELRATPADSRRAVAALVAALVGVDRRFATLEGGWTLQEETWTRLLAGR